MHNLSTSFVLGYHGCDRAVGEQLLQNEKFKPSENNYDWLGHGIYFWEANPKRALDWAKLRARQLKAKGTAMEPFVVGAVIDLGYCLDLTSANGIEAVEEAYAEYKKLSDAFRLELPKNLGGSDYLKRYLDCAVIQYLHQARIEEERRSFDTVRAVFTEGDRIYPNAGFRKKTHIQICVRKQAKIHGVFRVRDSDLSAD